MLTSDPDAIVDAPSALEEDPADDAGLRWGVAGVVSVIRHGFAPGSSRPWPKTIGRGPDRSDTSIPPAVAASTRNRYLACAALYAVAYAAHGFDPSNAAAGRRRWPTRRPARAPRGGECVVASALAASSSSKTLAEKDAARGEGPDSDSGSGSDGVPGGDWAGGEDPPGVGLPFRALDVRLPDGLPSLPSVRAPEVPEITVESVGRAIGATQIAAAKLREEVEEGKIRAIIEQDAKAVSKRLPGNGRWPRRRLTRGTSGSNFGR